MQRLLFLLLSSVLMLSGCNDSDYKVEAEFNLDSVTPKQQEVLSNYEDLNGKGESVQVIKNHYKTFLRSENPIEKTDEIISEYNKAIANIITNEKVKIGEIERTFDYLVLSEENSTAISEIKEEIIANDINKLMEIYNNKNYESIGSPTDYNDLSSQDEEFKAVYAYLWIMNSPIFGRHSVSYLMEVVDYGYSGLLSEDIYSLIIKEDRFTEWKDKNITAIKKYNPFIGMTDIEARESTWGIPEKINRTETTYGVREQWVYPNYNYLYFEDGYLVAITTSK